MSTSPKTLFVSSLLFAAGSLALLTAAAFQGKKTAMDKDEAAVPTRWEIYGGGGLYFLDRKTGEMWVYHHPGDVTLTPRPKYLGRMTEVGKEMEK
jgi:hypothetical protein